MSRHDVIVVGTGLAGLSAAVRLAESGARVLVLAKGVGATHLAPGTIDVLGYAPERVARPREALAAFVAQRPEHPYARVGAEGIEAAIAWFKAKIGNGPLGPYDYTGTIDENLLLPTAIGVPRPSAVVPVTMAGGDLRAPGPVVAVGFRAMKDFHPTLMADELTRVGFEARGIMCDAAPPGRADASSLMFARAFDEPAFRNRFAGELAPKLRAGERVAVPAVLGIANPHTVWSELEQRLARPVFEVPTLPPSVPGMRVFATLREALRRAGGQMRLNNVVVGADREGERVRTLRVRVGLREERHEADWIVVAHGGVAGGGVALGSDWIVRETALGLPISGAPADGEPRFAAGYFDPQPMAATGVAVDGSLRPAGFENVLVAGASLAGAVPWKEKSGDGVSLATGFAAAGVVLGASMAATRS